MTIWSGNHENHGNSQLAIFVKKRLPRDYLLAVEDLRWLDACDRYLTDEASPWLVLQATKRACQDGTITQHIDPFEQLIDAQICSPRLEIMPVQKNM